MRFFLKVDLCCSIPVGLSIDYCMKLLDQILSEMGGDTLKSFTVIPGFGGYFRSIKSIAEFSPQKIVLRLKKHDIILAGEDMQVGKYFEEDIFIKGNIEGIQID